MTEIQKNSIFSVLTQVRSNKNILPPVEEIESLLAKKTTQMLDFEKTGKYIQAEECKENVEKLKAELNEKKLYDLTLKHRRQKRKMEKNHEEELTQLLSSSNNIISEHNAEGARLQSQMELKHQLEINTVGEELEAQIPIKMKQSSECLNLRRIQLQLAKQRQYIEAHQIQQQIIQMEKKEKQMFQKQRQARVEAGLNVLKARQKIQLQALQKKIKAGQSELDIQKQTQISIMKLKHENALKQLKSQQQKEVLFHKGQIKNKSTLTSFKSKTKLPAFNSTS